MKRAITRELAKIIPTIRCHGDFYASGRSEIIMPNLEVDGVGRIALPLLPMQAEQLVAVAERAPYGRGEETLVDTEVRRTWQIDAAGIHLAGQSWPKTLDAMVAKVAAGLGVTEPVTAELYKLLIYDTGSFFVEHRDTEKIPGMFATLVVALPSVSSGGELIVRHRGREVCLDLGGSDSAAVAFAAFYADCVHEVRPVTSGYRLVLIYNLARAGRRQPSAPPAYDGEQSAIAALLRRWVANKDSPDDGSPDKLVYPLEHAYTPAELAFNTLKNADAAAAGVLIRAADEADCDLYLALVSIEETGTAEYAGYASRRRSRWYRDRDEDDEGGDDDFEIGEIIERTLTISDWRQPDGSKPAITALPFEEDELCPPGSFDELEPDEQHFHEATGNEGATFERTYRRAAFVLWPRTRRLAVMHQAGLGVTLPYLSDLAARWEQSGKSQASPQWHDAHTLAGYMLHDWPASRGYCGNGDQVICMVASLTQLRDTAHLDTLLDIMPARWMYHGSENEALARAAGLLLPQRASELVEQIIAWNAQMMPGACAGLLARIGESGQFGNSPVLLHPAATTLVQTLTGQRTSPARPDSFHRPEPIAPSLIDDLLTALAQIDAPLLADLVVGHVLAHPTSFGLDAIVVPTVVALCERALTANTASVRRLRAACLAHLRDRIGQPLAPPADFARANPNLCRCPHCAALGQFLVDPARKEWGLKAAEPVRRHVESAIQVHGCDVDCQTSRVGRPYSLIFTKNQASYQRRVRQRKEDLRNLERLESVPEQGAQPGAGPDQVNVQERETDDEK